MNDAIPPMPTALKLVIGFFALSFCFDVWIIVTGAATTAQWVRAAIAVGIIVGLVRGSDGVRAIVRALSILGVIAGVIAVLRIVPFIGDAPMGLLAFGLGAGVLAIAGSLFTFFVLGLESVQTWMARSSFARTA